MARKQTEDGEKPQGPLSVKRGRTRHHTAKQLGTRPVTVPHPLGDIVISGQKTRGKSKIVISLPDGLEAEQATGARQNDA